MFGDRTRFRHSVLLRLGAPIAYEDLRPRGVEAEAVLELTRRIREALYPLTLHAPQEQTLMLAQDLAWLLAEAPGERVNLEAFRGRVQALLPLLEARQQLLSTYPELRNWIAQSDTRAHPRHIH